MDVGLINFNKRGVSEPGVPPVPPIGLEYLADDLRAAGHEVSLLDLCFVPREDRPDAIADFAHHKEFVGVTFRNMGTDCLLLEGEQFYVPELETVVREIRAASKAPIVLGGQGYSIFPQKTLEYVGADYGISGPGELALVKLLDSYHSTARGSVLHGPANTEITRARSLIDYNRYFENGGSAAIQTRNGCPFPCGFCIESKKTLYRRNVDRIIEELRTLKSLGATFVFFADPEFNNHLRQAELVCDALIEADLGLTWSCYLNTIPMTQSFAHKLKAAGCVQPCVSMVSGCNDVLKAFDTHFSTEDIRRTAEMLHNAGVEFTVDILVGGPGDTAATVAGTYKLMEEIRPSVVGANLGIRLFPTTPFGKAILNGKYDTVGRLYGATHDNPDFYKPIFYVSEWAAGEAFMEIAQSDRRYNLFGFDGFGGVNYKAAGADQASEAA
ncbi:B12-binding domain-containing radical SAM protein [Sphingobium indicum]